MMMIVLLNLIDRFLKFGSGLHCHMQSMIYIYYSSSNIRSRRMSKQCYLCMWSMNLHICCRYYFRNNTHYYMKHIQYRSCTHHKCHNTNTAHSQDSIQKYSWCRFDCQCIKCRLNYRPNNFSFVSKMRQNNYCKKCHSNKFNSSTCNWNMLNCRGSSWVHIHCNQQVKYNFCMPVRNLCMNYFVRNNCQCKNYMLLLYSWSKQFHILRQMPGQQSKRQRILFQSLIIFNQEMSTIKVTCKQSSLRKQLRNHISQLLPLVIAQDHHQNCNYGDSNLYDFSRFFLFIFLIVCYIIIDCTFLRNHFVNFSKFLVLFQLLSTHELRDLLLKILVTAKENDLSY